MQNLDDTAIVAVDYGEFGIYYQTVSDDILENGRWKDTMAKNRTIEELILNHNYLKSAYRKLEYLEPKEIHYKKIKEMVLRYEDPQKLVGGIQFTDREYALYGLAKFKKSEDIHLIKEQIISNRASLTEISFRLMKEFPNEAYLEVYEDYYPRSFYWVICRDRNTNLAEEYITSLATYQNQRSARILNEILNRKPFMPCTTDTNYIKKSLIYAIWNNKCPVYLSMLNQIRGDIEKLETEKLKYSSLTPLEIEPVTPDTSFEPIRWWR